jgi:hypothetical protein
MAKTLNELGLVLSVHRSGSSLLTGALQAAGAGLGQFEDTRNWANPSGYFEHPSVRDFGDELLRHLNASWDNWAFTADAAHLAGPDFLEFRQKAVRLLQSIQEKSEGPLVVKDPRIAQILPFWESALSEASIGRRRILLIRDPAEVAASQCARAARAPAWHPCLQQPEPMCALWAQMIYTVLITLPDDTTLLVRHEDLYRSPRDTAVAAARFLGIEPRLDRLDAFLKAEFSASLRRASPSCEPGPWGKMASKIFQELAEQPGPRRLTREEARTIAERQSDLIHFQPMLPAIQQSLASLRSQLPAPSKPATPASDRPALPARQLPAQSRHDISQFLFARNTPEAVDLAFVMGCPNVNSLFPALTLFKTGLTRRILISGSGKTAGGKLEWELYRDVALAEGVPAEALFLEPEARNTLENLTFGARIIERDIGWSNVQSIGLCAKPFHMRRVLMTARKVIPSGIRLLALPADHPENLSAETWSNSEHGIARVMVELGKISRYGLQGDFDEP